MKKTIQLTENKLKSLIKRAILESIQQYDNHFYGTYKDNSTITIENIPQEIYSYCASTCQDGWGLNSDYDEYGKNYTFEYEILFQNDITLHFNGWFDGYSQSSPDTYDYPGEYSEVITDFYVTDFTLLGNKGEEIDIPNKDIILKKTNELVGKLED